jgi:hypothetical protein
MAKGKAPRDRSVVRHSFVVRIWYEGTGSEWRGWVQHTRTGETALVQSPDELLSFIERRTGKPSGPPRKGLR